MISQNNPIIHVVTDNGDSISLRRVPEEALPVVRTFIPGFDTIQHSDTSPKLFMGFSDNEVRDAGLLEALEAAGFAVKTMRWAKGL